MGGATPTAVSGQAPVPVPAGVRALAPDIARGFMLLFIAIANVSTYLWGHSSDGATGHPTDGSMLDRVLAAFAMVFIDARIYPMFALLFGYGISQFTMSRWNRGVPIQSIRRMLKRRHLWLIVFGFVHALLFFSGDILGAYGLSGLLLAGLFLTSSDRTLKVTAWILAGLLAAGAVGTVVIGALLEGVVGDADVGALTTSLASPEGASVGDMLMSGSGADLMSGIAHPLLAMLVRVGTWILSVPGVLLTLTVPLCMLIGMLAGRHRWLEGAATRVPLGRVAFWGIASAAVFALPVALNYLGVLHLGALLGAGMLSVSQYVGMLGGIGYAALFALLALRITAPLNAAWTAIAAVGRRSLTFYLLQSVVFAPVLSAWGLGIGVKINTAGAFGLALGVWVLSLVLALILERQHVRGPAEVLLRRLTYGKLDVSRPALVSGQAPGQALG